MVARWAAPFDNFVSEPRLVASISMALHCILLHISACFYFCQFHYLRNFILIYVSFSLHLYNRTTPVMFVHVHIPNHVLHCVLVFIFQNPRQEVTCSRILMTQSPCRCAVSSRVWPKSRSARIWRMQTNLWRNLSTPSPPLLSNRWQHWMIETLWKSDAIAWLYMLNHDRMRGHFYIGVHVLYIVPLRCCIDTGCIGQDILFIEFYRINIYLQRFSAWIE